MTKIIFVRHGQTEWNVLGRYQGQTDIALSPPGGILTAWTRDFIFG